MKRGVSRKCAGYTLRRDIKRQLTVFAVITAMTVVPVLAEPATEPQVVEEGTVTIEDGIEIHDEGADALTAKGEDTTVTVDGNISGEYSRGVVAEDGATVTVNGNITGGVVSAESTAVNITGDSTADITIHGSINSDSMGIQASKGNITVDGDVNASCALVIDADSSVNVVIGGDIKADYGIGSVNNANLKAGNLISNGDGLSVIGQSTVEVKDITSKERALNVYAFESGPDVKTGNIKTTGNVGMFDAVEIGGGNVTTGSITAYGDGGTESENTVFISSAALRIITDTDTEVKTGDITMSGNKAIAVETGVYFEGADIILTADGDVKVTGDGTTGIKANGGDIIIKGDLSAKDTAGNGTTAIIISTGTENKTNITVDGKVTGDIKNSNSENTIVLHELKGTAEDESKVFYSVKTAEDSKNYITVTTYTGTAKKRQQ